MNFYLAMPLIQAVVTFALIPLVLIKHYRKLANRLFALYLLGVTIWGILIYLMRSSPGLEQAYTWEKWLGSLVPLFAVIFFHFSAVYTRIRIRKWLLTAVYAACAVFLILSRTNLFIAGMQLKPYGYAFIPGPLFPLVGICGYLFMILGLINFIKASRTAILIDERNRHAYIIIGVMFSIIGAAFDILPLLGLPLYPGLIIGNIIFGLITTRAIIKYHLLDIHVVIRKATAYLLLSTAVAIPYVGIIFLLHQIFEHAVPFWAYFLLILVLAVSVQPLWSSLQRIVDRWFYGGRYDYIQALSDFSHKTHDISNFQQLGDSLVQLVSKALRINHVLLLLRNEVRDFVTVAASGNSTSLSTFSGGSPLIKWLQTNALILSIEEFKIVPMLQALTAAEVRTLNTIGIQLIVPLMTKKADLIGLLLLGSKLSYQPYTQEDKQILMAVADRVAIELENARLYKVEKAMREEVENQMEQRTEFLHSIAHELKTPLTAVISSIELLAEDPAAVKSSTRQRLISNIKYGAWLMEKRVNELLDLARIQTGTLELNLQSVNLAEIISDLVSQLQPVFANKKQALNIEITEALPAIWADKGKLEQILFNLLSNANKFSPNAGVITVLARKDDNHILVAVKDAAPAIPAEQREKLFDPYYRGEDAVRRQRISGLGLGLTIAKRIVELHKGNIWIESQAKINNIFTFSLPVNAAATDTRNQLEHNVIA